MPNDAGETQKGSTNTCPYIMTQPLMHGNYVATYRCTLDQAAFSTYSGVLPMKPSIVIVEDEVNIANAEKLILQAEYDVHLAHDGEEGLRLIKEVKPTLVVLDLMLPKMSGVEICKQIRADAALKGTKVVMVTAKNEDRDEQEGMDTGADDYIMKPFEPVELRHVVNQVLKE